MVIVQAAVPAQAPSQPAKVEPVAGVAVSVTVAPEAKFAVQSALQAIPAGLLVMVPVPVLLTVSAKVPTWLVSKVAVTALAAFMVTVQVPVPVQAPLQPAKLEPAAAVALRVTLVFSVKLEVQVLPQLIPAGVLLMAPPPVPAFVTLRAKVGTVAVA